MWLLESNEYTTWSTGASTPPLIWLYGIPGCGKTILSSTVIENILQYCSGDPGKAVAYYYFDFKDPEKQLPEAMIKSLISQLSQQCIRIHPQLETLYKSCNSSAQQLAFNIDKLVGILGALCEDIPAVYVVLDALDECTDRDTLTDILETIASWRLESLRMLVTSRKVRDIEETLSTIINADTNYFIPLERTIVDEDIRKYVYARISTDKKLKKWRNGEMQQEIEIALMQGAQGM